MYEGLAVGITQAINEAGVDDELPLTWMMVPRDGVNLALWTGGDGLTLVPDKKRLVKIYDTADPKDRKVAEMRLGAVGFVASPALRVVIVEARKGAGAGETIISAQDARSKNRGQVLEVSVKSPRQVNVVINFVRFRDASGNPVNHTSTDPSMAAPWVQGMNKIYTPQSNVVFKLQEARWVQYEKQFNRVIRPTDYEELFKKRIADEGVMNIFIVGEFEKDSNPRSRGDNYTGVTVNHQNIICEEVGDKDKHDMVKLLAHEAMHYLLREGHHDYDKKKTHWVLEQLSFQTGTKIPKIHANKINPVVTPKRGKK